MTKQDLFNIIRKSVRNYLDDFDEALEESKKHEELSDEWFNWACIAVDSYGAQRALSELSAIISVMDFDNESTANECHEFREIDDDGMDEEEICEACGGEIITRGNCGACLECDAQWGEPEYVECDECGGEAIIDALGFFCLDCNYQC